MNENNVSIREHRGLPQKEEFLIDLKQLVSSAILHWHWFVVSIIACVFFAGVYLWFTPSTVTVSGKMEIVDKSKKSSSMSAGMAMLNSLPMGLGSSLGGAVGIAGTVDTEVEIILSNTLVTNVVKDLKLYTEYRHSKWGRKKLLYQDNPVEVSLDDAHVAWLDAELPLYRHQIKLTITKDDGGYTVEPILFENSSKTEMSAQTFAQLPAVIKTDAGTLTLTENKLTPKQAKPFDGGFTLKVIITPPTEVAKDFIGRTLFEASNKKVTNIASISITDENRMRGIDYVNRLVEAYNKRANDEKNEEALKTDEFVNARLAKIDAELGSSDAAWENSKKNFQIADPEVDAQEAISKKSEYEAKLVAIGTELQLHDYLSEYINDPANLYEIIPSGLAGGASSASDDNPNAGVGGNAALIAQHNNLVNQRKNLLKSVSEMSPQVQRLNESIKELHPTLKLAMKRNRQQLVMQKNIVEREFAHYNGRIGTAPQMERVLTEIGRQREIKQGVYLLMLQKREETAMELANVTDKGRLIDPPVTESTSIRPKKKMVLFVAIFLGVLLPICVLYLMQIFKNKIDTREELAAVTKLPILAELDNNNFDEALRALRTNLLLNLKEGQKAVLVASNNTGDGKSFIAQRLTDCLTAIGKKAVLVNGDLRSLNLTNGQHAADIIAGAEFIAKVADAKSSNDYIIIDSPALGEYNDAYQLAAYADATLYVAKAGKAKKSDIESLATNKNLPNPLIVFNK